MLMDWAQRYPQESKPTEGEIIDFVRTPLWKELNEFLHGGYHVEPEMNYSSCSGQPGWNIRYRKSGRTICTLYPMPGFFIALVVIGNKEYEEALEVLSTCTPYIQHLFNETPFSAGGRWLMVHVTDEHVLEDVKKLVQVRRKIPR